MLTLSPQETVLFNTTILENFLYGLPEGILEGLSEMEKKDLVRSACKLANARDFIQALPKVTSEFIHACLTAELGPGL